MQTATQTQTDGFANLIARVQDVIGTSARPSKAVTTRPFSKSHPARSKRGEELRRNAPPSPRMWNETLAFAADG